MFSSLRTRLPRIGRWPRFALAALCLLLAASSALSARAAARAERTGVRVVVAARDLPAGHVLGSGDLRVAQWPARIRPAGAWAADRALLGRRLAGPVGAREPVTPGRLVGRDLAAGLGAAVTAVPVTIADPHTGDVLHPGDRIDLVTAGSVAGAGVDTGTPGGATTAPGGGSTVATALRVLSVFPVPDGGGTELIVAADTVTAERIVRVGVSQTLAAIVVPP